MDEILLYNGDCNKVLEDLISKDIRVDYTFTSPPYNRKRNDKYDDVEYFIVLGKESLKSNSTYTKNILTTLVNNNMPDNHKAVMKQEVSDYFINTFTKEDDTVLDPFMGTGTTGISCKQMGRKFIGIELDKEYFKIAKDRLDKEIDNDMEEW